MVSGGGSGRGHPGGRDRHYTCCAYICCASVDTAPAELVRCRREPLGDQGRLPDRHERDWPERNTSPPLPTPDAGTSPSRSACRRHSQSECGRGACRIVRRSAEGQSSTGGRTHRFGNQHDPMIVHRAIFPEQHVLVHVWHLSNARRASRVWDHVSGHQHRQHIQVLVAGLDDCPPLHTSDPCLVVRVRLLRDSRFAISNGIADYCCPAGTAVNFRPFAMLSATSASQDVAARETSTSNS